MNLFGPPHRVSFWTSPFSLTWFDIGSLPEIPAIIIDGIIVPNFVVSATVPVLSFQATVNG